jgi:mRNA deadenylase 3'-5' endonuclease subunit Ccr4
MSLLETLLELQKFVADNDGKNTTPNDELKAALKRIAAEVKGDGEVSEDASVALAALLDCACVGAVRPELYKYLEDRAKAEADGVKLAAIDVSALLGATQIPTVPVPPAAQLIRNASWRIASRFLEPASGVPEAALAMLSSHAARLAGRLAPTKPKDEAEAQEVADRSLGLVVALATKRIDFFTVLGSVAVQRPIWMSTILDKSVKAARVVGPSLPAQVRMVETLVSKTRANKDALTWTTFVAVVLPALFAAQPKDTPLPVPVYRALVKAAVRDYRIMVYVLPFVPRETILAVLPQLCLLPPDAMERSLDTFMFVERPEGLDASAPLPDAQDEEFGPQLRDHTQYITTAIAPPVTSMAELAVALHLFRPPGQKQVAGAATWMSALIAKRHLNYKHFETLLTTIRRETTLPLIAMRTVIALSVKYPAFRHMCSTFLKAVAARSPDTWTDEVLWHGFCLAIKALLPDSAEALGEMPILEREKVFLRVPEAKAHFDAHMTSKVMEGGPGVGNEFTGVLQFLESGRSAAAKRPYKGVPVTSLSKPSTGLPGPSEMTAAGETEETATAKASHLRPGQVRVVSYGILSAQRAQPHSFPHCPSSILAWDKRKFELASVLRDTKADIVCLQGLDHYIDFWKPQVHLDDLQTVYKQGTGDATEGICVMYRRDRYKQVLEQKIEFNNLAFDDPKSALSRRLLEDNVAIVMLLEPILATTGDKTALARQELLRVERGTAPTDPVLDTAERDTRSRIVVACVDLARGPNAADIRVLQMRHLLERIQRLVPTKASEPAVPVIVCGGINDTPDSMVNTYVQSGVLSAPTITSLAEHSPLKHKLQLESAYKVVLTEEQPYTTCPRSISSAKTTDYIYADAAHLQTLAVRPLVPLAELKDDIAMPSDRHPSDHGCLLAVFEHRRDPVHPKQSRDSGNRKRKGGGSSRSKKIKLNKGW